MSEQLALFALPLAAAGPGSAETAGWAPCGRPQEPLPAVRLDGGDRGLDGAGQVGWGWPLLSEAPAAGLAQEAGRLRLRAYSATALRAHRCGCRRPLLDAERLCCRCGRWSA